MSRVPPTTSESGKNTSGQEAFGSKVQETPMVESPAASATDVTSAAAGAGATAASEAEKVGTSAPRGTSDSREVPPSRGIIDEGMEVMNDEDRCLHAGTPWEAEVVTDRRGLETFKEAARTIGTVLLVRTFAEFLRFLLRVFEYHEV
jgi:hypothetical protein